MRALALEAARAAGRDPPPSPGPEAPAPAFARLAGLDRAAAAPVAHGVHQGRPVRPTRRPQLDAEALVVSAEYGDRDRPAARSESRAPAPGARRSSSIPRTSEPSRLRFFVVEYLREAAFELLEDELPYSFTAEVEEFREAERPVYIRVTLFVERESQKGIVIGSGGATIKALGAHARARLEELMGSAGLSRLLGEGVAQLAQEPSAPLTRSAFPEPRKELRMSLAPELLEFWSAPSARATSSTGPRPEALICHACRLVYPVEDGIPIMLIDEAKPL